MKFIITREKLLKPLQQVTNLIKSKPNLPILNNLLLKIIDNKLILISTDLEIEISVYIKLNIKLKQITITIPARKFFYICKNLPKDAIISIKSEEKRIVIYSGKSNYFLSTLSYKFFPNINNWKSIIKIKISQIILKRLIESTQFSMANQDTRHYLNGMLFEINNKKLSTIATDGHRLAVCNIFINTLTSNHSIIIPRKSVIELMRILNYKEEDLQLKFNENNISIKINNYTFTSKLISGNFPEYKKIILKKYDKSFTINCNILKQACSRVSILSNEKSNGVKFQLTFNQLKISTCNQEQEKAEEILFINYENYEIDINFNINYILDILNSLQCHTVKFFLIDNLSSVKIQDIDNHEIIYIIMPMYL